MQRYSRSRKQQLAVLLKNTSRFVPALLGIYFSSIISMFLTFSRFGPQYAADWESLLQSVERWTTTSHTLVVLQSFEKISLIQHDSAGLCPKTCEHNRRRHFSWLANFPSARRPRQIVRNVCVMLINNVAFHGSPRLPGQWFIAKAVGKVCIVGTPPAASVNELLQLRKKVSVRPSAVSVSNHTFW